MSGPRVLLGALVIGMAVGLVAGVQWSRGVAPAVRASAPAPAPVAVAAGADFSAIARQATPAVVNISALQVFRTERSPCPSTAIPSSASSSVAISPSACRLRSARPAWVPA
jgi:hypothetical protein